MVKYWHLAKGIGEPEGGLVILVREKERVTKRTVRVSHEHGRRRHARLLSVSAVCDEDMAGSNYILRGVGKDGGSIRFVLSSDSVVVGRQGDVKLHHESVSRQHARLELRDD